MAVIGMARDTNVVVEEDVVGATMAEVKIMMMKITRAANTRHLKTSRK